ncbi:MAG: hypothetical protein IAF08_16065 [Rhizobacter sp.]|nr:hypothetical protein [Chlorobiales bacterium]
MKQIQLLLALVATLSLAVRGGAQTFAEQNAGKILFSKKPIAFGKENISAVQSKFAAGDFIFAMVYLPKSIGASGIVKRHQLAIEIAGRKKEIIYVEYVFKDTDAKNIEFDVVSDPKDILTGDITQKMMKLFIALPPAKHSVTVSLTTPGAKKLATGSFELDCTAGTDKLKANSDAVRNGQLASVNMPEAKMKEASLEAAMLKAFRAQLVKVYQDKAGTPVRAVITDAGWTLVRNGLTGIVLRRQIWATLGVKTTNGNCNCQSVQFSQEYYSGKFQGGLAVSNFGTGYGISCDNLSK